MVQCLTSRCRGRLRCLWAGRAAPGSRGLPRRGWGCAAGVARVLSASAGPGGHGRAHDIRLRCGVLLGCSHRAPLYASGQDPACVVRPAPVVPGNTCWRWTTAGRRTPARSARSASPQTRAGGTPCFHEPPVPWRRTGIRGPAPRRRGPRLVESLTAAGRRILRTTELGVLTSARRQARAPRGFGHLLSTLAVCVQLGSAW